MNEDDTFMKLRLGHLEAKKDRLSKSVNDLPKDVDLYNFDKFQSINQELLDVHAEIIAILKEEAIKLDEEIERCK